MSQKASSIFLILCVIAFSVVMAFAAETDDTAAYDEAVAVLSRSGVTPMADTALTDGRGMAAAVELGLLQQEETLSLSALGAQALQEQAQQQKAAAEAEESRIRRAAYLNLYDGVQLEKRTAIRAKADSQSRSLRTIAKGKVAQLVDLTEDGWYKIQFAGTTGYVSAELCRGVDYDDYKGTAAAMDVTAELLSYARTWIGTPYVYGGASQSGTDCSGFTMSVFGKYGYRLSHGARSQYAAGTPVSVAERQRGDLVFFTGPGESGITHVGIYLGDGLFIHASTSQGVTIDNIYNAYYGTYYYGAVRILDE